jgi:hypothetical protein
MGAANVFRPLAGWQLSMPAPESVADAYANQLLRDLGAGLPDPVIGNTVDAALAWADSGLMFLCGELNQPPRQGPGAIPSCARGVISAIRMLAPQTLSSDIDGALLLSERAAMLGLHARGSMSPNQSCRVLPSLDGWLALNLARREDWLSLAAWLQADKPIDNWDSVRQAVAQRYTNELVERGRLLGLPLAAAKVTTKTAKPWFRLQQRGWQRPPPAATTGPLVIDLSSLWAGPLCSHLLQQAGARVIKVESLQRPDGARPGGVPPSGVPPSRMHPDESQADLTGYSDFYHLLNAGKSSVALDFSRPEGVRQLQALLRHADIVIEGSRPRALQQLGIDAGAIVQSKPGLVWLGISGYGRSQPEANWVAFGDDAAMAAGVANTGASSPLFVGDALADPLCGVHAALLALACWRAGEGALLDISLHDVAAHCLAYAPSIVQGDVVAGPGQQWQFAIAGHSTQIRKPQARRPLQLAARLGADTRTVLREFAIPC